jgi:hypothetical protein
MKNKAYYFSHDGNAYNDVKIQYLIADLGMEGYGIFWYIIERLFDAGGILPLRIVKILSNQINISEAKLNQIINDYELFEITTDSFYSKRLMKHFESREKLSNSGKKGASIKWGGYSQANGVAIDTPIARKEKKVKEKKEKEIKTKEKSLIITHEYDWIHHRNSFLKDENWKYKFTGLKKISKESLEISMNEFIHEIELKEKFLPSSELKNYFTNWYNLKKKKNDNYFDRFSKQTRGAHELLEELRAESQANFGSHEPGSDPADETR